MLIWFPVYRTCDQSQAIRLYQNCLKKFHGGRDPSLHIYLAHAYFDARQYNDCMRVLLKALHVSPNNLQLWYNLALARETFAVAVLQKEQKGEARTLAEVENAIEDLKVRKKRRACQVAVSDYWIVIKAWSLRQGDLPLRVCGFPCTRCLGESMLGAAGKAI